jgi:hypothetical protein
VNRTILVVITATALVAVAVVASAFADDHASTACGRGVPAFKCDPGAPVAAPVNRPAVVAAPAPYWPSPDVIACGSSFFPKALVSRLSSRFGSLQCFRFAQTDRWIVFADGMQVAGDGPAPGGALVAVETCVGPQRSSCLDPTAVHDLGAFVVTRPPDPRAWPMRLQTSFGSRLLYVADGSCGVLTLDLSSLHWLGKATEAIDSAMTGGSPPPVAAPRAEPGSGVFAGHAPAPSGACHS